MVDRIKRVMDFYKETPASFAEKIGVNRSNLTHLFSGRNQPSLDFAKKVLTAFPEVSTEWLIMGVGEMIKDPAEEITVKRTFVQTDLFSNVDEGVEDTEETEAVQSNGILSDNEMQKEGLRSEEEEAVNPVEATVFDAVEEQQIEPVSETVNAPVVDTEEEQVLVEQQISPEEVETVETVVKKTAKSEQMSTPVRRVKSAASEKRAQNRIESVEPKYVTREKRPIATAPESKIQNPTVPMSGKSNSQPVERTLSESRMAYQTFQPTEKPQTSKEKKIEKIIFFYDDDSFKVYHP